MRRVAIVLISLAGGVLGYGWWHAATHATFYMSLSDKSAGGRYGQVMNAQLEFLDSGGATLARGKTDGKFGVVWIAHPDIGYCGPDLAQPAYGKCFDAHATWLLTWVPQVRRVSLIVGGCRLERVPLRFSEYNDSVWTWWLPLRHVGGTPYTNYSAYLEVDSKACAIAGRTG